MLSLILFRLQFSSCLDKMGFIATDPPSLELEIAYAVDFYNSTITQKLISTLTVLAVVDLAFASLHATRPEFPRKTTTKVVVA
jgi:hypothetical protein